MTVDLDHAPAAFNARLERLCSASQSHLCVGLDPDVKHLTPAYLEWVSASLSWPIKGGMSTDLHAVLRELVSIVICSTDKYAAAFKPNAAFFEAMPNQNEGTLKDVSDLLTKRDPLTIRLCDAKRGDIGNTSAKYAEAVFTNDSYDCITVNPLMGWDSVEPFVRDAQKGVFLLCLTSNPGADDFLVPNDLYLRIAEKAMEWNTNDNIGLVVGATRPDRAAAIRQVAPDLPFLIPGIGAQGGSLKETLDAIDAKNNKRFIINASRSVMFPPIHPERMYTEAVEASAKTLRDEINSFL